MRRASIFLISLFLVVALILPGCDSGEEGPSSPGIVPPPQTTYAPPVLQSFNSNGDLIQGWYWLRDRALNHYAEWTFTGVPSGSEDLSLEITALATNTYSGGRGYNADFLLLYGSGPDASLNSMKVTLPNVSPPSDPVGYTCKGTVVLPRSALGGGTTLFLRVKRQSPSGNHVAFNAESMGGLTLSDATASNDGEAQGWGSSTADADGDGVSDEMEAFFGMNPNTADTDGDGVSDGEDISPLINPTEPQWREIQEVGMIRIEQPIEAYGLDGWAEKYDLDLTLTGFELKFDARYESSGTKKSEMTESAYKKALNRVFEADHFTAYDVKNIAPADIGVQSEELTHDKDPEKSVIFEADVLHPNEYRFYYDYLTDFQMAYLKNTLAMRYPNDTNFFRYLLYRVQLKSGYESAISFEFKDPGMYQWLSYTDDSHYTIPGFLFAFYASNDFNADSNVPYHEGLALALIKSEGAFRVNIRIPKEKATRSSAYLKITPVRIERKGFKVQYTPMVPSWDLTGIVRETIYLQDAAGNSKTITEEMLNFDGLGTAPVAISVLASPSSSSGVQTKTGWMGIIRKDPREEEDSITVMDVAQTVATLVDRSTGLVEKAVTYTENFVQAVNKVDDLDDLPETHWARSPKYTNATTALSAVTGIISIVTDGKEVWTAYQEGSAVKVVYYSIKTVSSAAGAAPTMVKIAEKTLGYTGKATKLKVLSSNKASVGIAIAIGVVDVAYHSYELATTDDPILQTAHAESIAAGVIDTGLSVAAVFSPHVLVFQLTWTLEAEIYSWIFGEDFAYKVAQSPGSAVVFLAEYFFSDVIPSQIAEEAYLSVREDIIRQIENINSVDLPYLCIFIDPDL